MLQESTIKEKPTTLTQYKPAGTFNFVVKPVHLVQIASKINCELKFFVKKQCFSYSAFTY